MKAKQQKAGQPEGQRHGFEGVTFALPRSRHCFELKLSLQLSAPSHRPFYVFLDFSFSQLHHVVTVLLLADLYD